jgi:hypothetical protein
VKFIDLYNRARKTECFKARVQQFKMFVYLAKNNPERYSVKWNDKQESFNYFESTVGMNGEKTWTKFENQCPKYNQIGYFKPNH